MFGFTESCDPRKNPIETENTTTHRLLDCRAPPLFSYQSLCRNTHRSENCRISGAVAVDRSLVGDPTFLPKRLHRTVCDTAVLSDAKTCLVSRCFHDVPSLEHHAVSPRTYLGGREIADAQQTIRVEQNRCRQ